MHWTDDPRIATLRAMLQIAKTPTPPYYAVIAPAVLAGDIKGYPEMAVQLMET